MATSSMTRTLWSWLRIRRLGVRVPPGVPLRPPCLRDSCHLPLRPIPRKRSLGRVWAARSRVRMSSRCLMRTGTLQFGRPTGEGFGSGATWRPTGIWQQGGHRRRVPRTFSDRSEVAPTIRHQIDDPADGAPMGALSTRVGESPSAGLAFHGERHQVASCPPLHQARQPVPRFGPENAKRNPSRPATNGSCRTHTWVKGRSTNGRPRSLGRRKGH